MNFVNTLEVGIVIYQLHNKNLQFHNLYDSYCNATSPYYFNCEKKKKKKEVMENKKMASISCQIMILTYVGWVLN